MCVKELAIHMCVLITKKELTTLSISWQYNRKKSLLLNVLEIKSWLDPILFSETIFLNFCYFLNSV